VAANRPLNAAVWQSRSRSMIKRKFKIQMQQRCKKSNQPFRAALEGFLFFCQPKRRIAEHTM
jgi:hypothetical protein